MSMIKNSTAFQEEMDMRFALSYEEEQYLRQMERAKTMRQAEAEAQEGEEIDLYFESVIPKTNKQ